MGIAIGGNGRGFQSVRTLRGFVFESAEDARKAPVPDIVGYSKGVAVFGNGGTKYQIKYRGPLVKSKELAEKQDLILAQYLGQINISKISEKSEQWAPPTPEQIFELRNKAQLVIGSEEGFNISIAPKLIYDRSTAWREYVLARTSIAPADHCEYCLEKSRYFELNGRPRFTPHHMHELSDGGSDKPWNISRLHYDCHDAAHHSAHSAEINRVLIERISQVELKAPKQEQVFKFF